MKIAIYNCIDMASAKEKVFLEEIITDFYLQIVERQYTDIEYMTMFFDTNGGDKLTDRPLLACLLNACKNGEYDTVVFARGADTITGEELIQYVACAFCPLDIRLDEINRQPVDEE